jgi:hypothetical protein
MHGILGLLQGWRHNVNFRSPTLPGFADGGPAWDRVGEQRRSSVPRLLHAPDSEEESKDKQRRRATFLEHVIAVSRQQDRMKRPLDGEHDDKGHARRQKGRAQGRTPAFLRQILP